MSNNQCCMTPRTLTSLSNSSQCSGERGLTWEKPGEQAWPLFLTSLKNVLSWGFPGGTVVKNLPANAGDTGSSPGPGRSHMPRSN